MKILITSGGTTEYIDDVRVLTNISTGKLGVHIAERLELDDHEIEFVHAKGSVLPNTDRIRLHQIKDVDSLVLKMEELVPTVDVVIHCMAVSDFGFIPTNTKLKSNDPQAFIDSLRDRIKINPKVLSIIKTWNSKCLLVSFKFEVNQSHDDLIKIARESMLKNNCDIVVANDKNEIVQSKSHVAYILKRDGSEIKAESKRDIADLLAKIIKDDVRISY